MPLLLNVLRGLHPRRHFREMLPDVGEKGGLAGSRTPHRPITGFLPPWVPFGAALPLLVCAALVVAIALPALDVAPAAAAQGTIVDLGVIQPAAQQATATGQTIWTLQAWGGLVYAGYGDYGANTGPISVSAYDPSSNAFSYPWTSQTEAIYNYRPIGPALYAPAIDDHGGCSDDYASSAPAWADHAPVCSVHAFDMVTLTGSDLWLVGAGGYNADAWRSLDGGLTWTLAMSEGPVSGISGDGARYYFAGVLNGKLYVQAADYYGSIHPNSKVFDGQSWASGPNLLAATGGIGWRAQSFAGKLVYKSYATPTSGFLAIFNGTSASTPGFQVYEFAVDGSTLYALDTSGNVRATTDLNSWSTIATFPTTSRSIAVLNGTIYVGTTNSHLLTLSTGPVPTPTSTAPALPTSTPTLAPTASTTPVSAPTATSTPTSPPTSTPTAPPTLTGSSDTTPPSMTIVTPSNNSTLPSKGSFKIQATASDASGVAWISLGLDGATLKTCSAATSCQASVSVNGVATGTHTITATAADQSPNGNRASVSITVTK